MVVGFRSSSSYIMSQLPVRTRATSTVKAKVGESNDKFNSYLPGLTNDGSSIVDEVGSMGDVTSRETARTQFPLGLTLS